MLVSMTGILLSCCFFTFVSSFILFSSLVFSTVARGHLQGPQRSGRLPGSLRFEVQGETERGVLHHRRARAGELPVAAGIGGDRVNCVNLISDDSYQYDCKRSELLKG